MELDRTVCYRALRTRDARFDGRFFTAVRSTGVFCRPVCPAPIPRLVNCEFMASAAAAHAAGYRPCLRCRPEAAPGTPAWQGSSSTVARALRLIGEGALNDGTVDALAGRLGMGERQLRRLFVQHLGATPGDVARTGRLLFAKQLIDGTNLPFSELAFAAGFASVRRFNEAIRETYGRPPSELRRGATATKRPSRGTLELRLPFRAPFDWPAVVGYLSGRAIPGVESADASGYRRTVRVDGAVGWFEVSPVENRNELRARLQCAHPAALMRIHAGVRRIFDLDADPRAIADELAADPELGPDLALRPGLRVPGTWDPFELAVRAILGQQVSVRGATTLAGRLVDDFGEKLPPDATPPGPAGSLARLFPEPDALADVELERIGLPSARAGAIRALAQAVAREDLCLDAALPLEQSVEALCRLPGIGPWTAQYVALRGLREPDAFPAGDLGLRKALAHPGAAPVSTRELEQRAEAWRPWRGYAALHLWHRASPRSSEEERP
jgi:AraC family transcriptional regulator of adaptative response / DNA-3-methyladenine glycosylase II